MVAPCMAGQLHNVAAAQAAMTKPYALLWVHRERWRTVFVVRKWAAPDPLLADAPEASRATESIGLVYDRNEPLRLVYRPRVGDALIPLAASLSSLM
jgi:hypothetical protein